MADTREQPLAEHDFVWEPLQFQGVSNDPLLPKNLSQLDPMVCLHVLVRPPTGWLVRSYHRARCVHDVLHRCHSPDVGWARGAPASVIQEPHAAAAHQNSLVVRRYRHLPRDIDIDIDERHQPCHWCHEVAR